MEYPTFERFLLANLRRSDPHPVIDFSLRANVSAEGDVTFYIHPANTGGDTPRYGVIGNKLTLLRETRIKE